MPVALARRPPAPVRRRETVRGAVAGAALGPTDSITPLDGGSKDDSVLQRHADAARLQQLMPQGDQEPGSPPSVQGHASASQRDVPALEDKARDSRQQSGLQRIDQDRGAQLTRPQQHRGLQPARQSPADFSLRGGRSMVELVGMWDALAPRLPADASPAAQTLLSALKLAVAHSPPPAAETGQAHQRAEAVGPALAPVAATGGSAGSGALAIALRLADISSAGVPVDAEAIAAGMLAGASRPRCARGRQRATLVIRHPDPARLLLTSETAKLTREVLSCTDIKSRHLNPVLLTCRDGGRWSSVVG